MEEASTIVPARIRKFTLPALLIAALAVWVIPGQGMAMPKNLEAAERAKYTCPEAKDGDHMAGIATELRQQSHDKNALACTMDLRFELANLEPSDLDAQLVALEALNEYIEHVRTLKLFDLVRLNWAEYALRLEHAAELRAALVLAAQHLDANDPRVMILTTLSGVLLAGPDNPEVRMQALEKLKTAVARDRSVLRGAGQIAIARIYLDLPFIFGGGADKALPYLLEARQIAPGNLRVLRYLVESYDELRQPDEARETLRKMAALEPRDMPMQQVSDEWRMGEGLASRMGETPIAEQFAALRAELMAQHPELLLRNVETVFGHGGSNPLTGEPQYIGEGAVRQTDGSR